MKRSGLVWLLLICLVLVNGLMAAPSVAHAAHHDGHKPGTHSTGLCAWLCAAGQGIETHSVPFNSTLQFIETASVPVFVEAQDLILPHAYVRGPPALLS